MIRKLEPRQTIPSATKEFYRIIQPLGLGGNSHVYLVEAITGENRGVLFALKLFVQIEKQGRESRFNQEIDFLKRANHPSIMRVFDNGILPIQEGTTRKDYPFVIAEYLPTTLRDLMQRPVRMVDKISYALQILSGLAYLSKQTPAVVHRDIKPENIFVRGAACIIGDFGLMKVLVAEESAEIDKEFMIESTGVRFPRYYRSPDLVNYCRGKDLLTSKSDVFQAGLVLAELFSGNNPLQEAKEPLDPVHLGELHAIPGTHGPMIRAHIGSMLEFDLARRPNAQDLFDPWEGTFLDAVQLAHSLDGKAF